jgi:Rod binding domain-containing protein
MEFEWIQRYSIGQTGPSSNPDVRSTDQQRLKEVCQEFEAIFLHEILKGFRRTVPHGGSRQEAIYRSLMDEQIARVCAKRGLGLADLLLSRLPQNEKVDEKRQIHGAPSKDFREEADN